MDKHVSFYTEKTLDTFNTLTATRVSDEILFQATWCATVAKHILLGTAIDILLTRVAITRKNNLPRYLFRHYMNWGFSLVTSVTILHEQFERLSSNERYNY